jgi:hypothetical protein
VQRDPREDLADDPIDDVDLRCQHAARPKLFGWVSDPRSFLRALQEDRAAVAVNWPD